MTKHDRLMKALAEIKDICAKNDDEGFGCGKRCPFLMAEVSNGFRDCEIMCFTRHNDVDTIDSPSEWAEEGER